MNNQTLELSTLMAALASVPDWRDNRGKHHRLGSVLALVVCGLLCGCKSVAAIARFGRWLEPEQQAELGFVAYPPPSVATIWRILTHIEAQKLEQVLSAWAAQAPVVPDEAVAIDGKTVRGSRRKEQAGVHLLAAYTHNTGVVVAQQAVGTKANEISAAPDLLDSVDLRGKVVTGDAMYTQRTLCEQIVKAGGHYLVVVKANQPDLLEALQTLFLSLSGSSVATNTVRSGMGDAAATR